MKAVLGNWGDIKVSDINRLLKPFNVRLIKKTSKAWGAQVSLTAHHIVDPAAKNVDPGVRDPQP